MESLKQLIEKKIVRSPKCPMCGDRQGQIVLEEGISWFRCCACRYRTRMKSYRDELKEYHERTKDDLEVVEVDCG